MGTSETLRSVIDAGRSAKRLDELSSARVIGKIAQQVHAAQQKAGAGKAIGPITPQRIAIATSGEVTLASAEGSTLGYTSPEQISGGSGDRRSDVFSLGTVMWEALTHQRLFDAMNDAAVKAAVTEREIKPPSELNANIPAELSAICMRALSRNPTDRYQSLKSMAVEIEEFLEEAGYADDDTKIAQFLAALPKKPTTLPLPPLASPKQTQPPPTGLRPAGASSPPPNASSTPIPSILKEEPKPSPGAALAAKLASAGSGLPAVSTTATAVGVPAAPVASEWQDKAPPPVTEPPAAAPTVPLTPLPPVLPSGSSTSLRNDPKATISAVVPPQVKVATTVDAKHAEAKPQAVIVEEKPKAVIVEEPEDTKATLVDTNAAVKAAEAAKAEIDKKAEATHNGVNGVAATLDAKHAEAKTETKTKTDEKKVEAKADEAKADEAKTLVKGETKTETKAEAKTDEKKVEAKTDETKADEAKTLVKGEVKGEAKTEAKTEERPKKATGPHPASVVSLPGRESKQDLLAGWGWGTGANEAIAPDGYVDHDEDFHTPPSSKKTLLYVIGGGLAAALLIVVIAFAAGGSDTKTAKSTQTAAKPDTAQTKNVASDPPPNETPTPVETGSATGSADTGSVSAQAAVVDPAAEAAAKEAAAKAAADQAAADKEAEAKRKADEEAAAKAAAAQAKADAEAAAAKAKLDAEAQRKADAERKKQEAEAAKLAEADRKKLEAEAKKAEAERKKQEAAAARQAEAERKKQEAEAKRAEAAAKKADAAAKQAEAKRVAQEEAAKKAEAKRLAQEDAAKKKAEQLAKASTGTPTTTTAKTRDKTTTTTAKTVATADTKKTEPKPDAPKVDPDTAYRQGLQAFARGDTQGALTSLRSALSANPNHPPTWRGLGLVFEKMGEKDQAKAAYKRYLQLAPTAGDAEIIRGRLERLGS